MQYKNKFMLALISSMIFAGCEKDSAGNENAPKSNWSIDGVTYTEGTIPATYSTSGNNLSASDNSLNGEITIQFGSKPTSNGSVALTDLSDTSVYGSGNCSISVRTPPNTNYLSSGNSGAPVSITVRSGGKITATFSNIQVKNISVPSIKKYVSGTIIER